MELECQKTRKGSSGVGKGEWNEVFFATHAATKSVPHSLIQQTKAPELKSICSAHVAKSSSKSTRQTFVDPSSSCCHSSSLLAPDSDCNSRSAFVDVPAVLILEVFKHLDARELSIVSCVCSLFRRLSSDSDGWKDFYCERWGLPALDNVGNCVPSLTELSWRELYVAREARSKAFLGRYRTDMMHGHTAAVRCVRLLPLANLIFTAGYDSILRIWNLEEGLLWNWSRPLGSTLRAIAVDMQMLVVAGTDAKVRIWQAIPDLPHLFDVSGISTGSFEVTLTGHTGPITSLGLDNIRIYSGSWDMTVKVWDRTSLKCVRTLMHMDWVWALVPRGHSVVSTAGSDVYTWDMDTGELLRLRTGVHSGQAYAVECSRSGHFVFTGGEDGVIRMFDDRNSQKQLVSSSESGESSAASEAVAYWELCSGAIHALSLEDPWLVSASGDGLIAMMDVRKIMKKFNFFIKSTSSVDSTLKQHGRSQLVASIHAEPPQRMLAGFHQSLYTVDVGADRVISAGEEKIIRVWDFSQALEIERRVQASRTIRWEHRIRQKQAAEECKGKHIVGTCNAIAKRDGMQGGAVWRRSGEGSKA